MAALNAEMSVILERKIKPETYTAGGVENNTFSIKADYIRKIDYSAPNEASEGQRGRARQEGQVAPVKPGGISSEPPLLCPGLRVLGNRLIARPRAALR